MRKFNVTKGESILSFLCNIDPRTNWLKEFEEGKVRVDKYFVGPHYTLNIGNTVIHDPTFEILEPKVNTNYQVLYEDEYFVAINKPAPLPIHPTGTYFHHSLTKILLQQKRNWYPIHRLDNETSGVLLLAKNTRYIEDLSEALRIGEKTYVVMIYGTPSSSRFNIKIPLGNKDGSAVFKRQGYHPKGKYSHTEFRLIRTFSSSRKNENNKTRSLLLARLHTGRSHQIRAHLAEQGMAIVGDKIYGKDENYFITYLAKGLTPALQNQLEISRQFLHCRSVTLTHPFYFNNGNKNNIEYSKGKDPCKRIRIAAPLEICPELTTYLEKIK